MRFNNIIRTLGQRLLAVTLIMSAAILSPDVSASEAGQGLPEENMAVYKELAGSSLVYASGAGAWDNTLMIKEDGTFQGIYHDSDMGTTGPGYPGGTMYYCEYNGMYGVPDKLSDTCYEMELMFVDYSTPVDTEEIKNEIRYSYSDAWGISNGSRFRLYLAGTPLSEMPEYVGYTPRYGFGANLQAIPDGECVLCNLDAEICFVGYPTTEQETAEKNEHILPEVAIRNYTKKQINKLTLQEVNYAKNEVYAMHGRIFQSQELNEYFSSKSWYYGWITGSEFDDSVFNEFEQHNLKLLVEREQELAGDAGYILDQDGYDITAVRMGFLDKKSAQTY